MTSISSEHIQERIDAERCDRKRGLKAIGKMLRACGDPSREAILLALRRSYWGLLANEEFLFDVQREQIELDIAEIDRKMRGARLRIQAHLTRAREKESTGDSAAVDGAMACYYRASRRESLLGKQRDDRVSKLFRLYDELDAARQRRTA